MIFLKNIASKWYILIALLCTAIVVFYAFPSLPKNLSEDEVDFARLAFHLQTQPYTPYTPLVTGHTTLYFYTLLASFKMFGVTTFALRLPIALFSVLNAGVLASLLFRVFSTSNAKNVTMVKWVSLLATLCVTLSHWYITFARFGFEAPMLLFFELISLYGLVRSLARKQVGWAIISGVFAGLAFHSYLPGRIFFIVPLLYCCKEALQCYRKKIDIKKGKNVLFGFLVSFLLVASPLIVYFVQNSDNPDIRVNQLSYVNNNSLTVQEKIEFAGENLRTITAMFFIRGDGNGRHNFPFKSALNPIMGILFVFGLVLSIYDLKKRKTLHPLLIFFVISLLPAQLTYPWENPNMLRTYTSLLTISYCSGLFMMWFSRNVQQRWIRIPQNVLVIALICLIGASTVYELRTYFVYQPIAFEGAFTSFEPLDAYIKRSIEENHDSQFNLIYENIFPTK